MKYRILIDATTIIEKKDGLSQYIISLLNNFSEEALDSYEISVLVNKGLQREEFWEVIKTRGYKTAVALIAPIGPKREWDMFRYLLKHKNEFDLFHSTSNQYPAFLKNGIATVHDITFKKYLNSKWWTFNMGSRFLNFVIKNALKNAAAVIAVSEYTKKDLIENYKINLKDSEKIKVIYEGWEHLKDIKADESSESFPKIKDYLFYVGTTRVHKNMKNLLKAFNIAIASLPKNTKLVVSGNETYLNEDDKATIAAINKDGERVLFTGFVSNSRLKYLFKNADAFIFPSLSEGFGIPVLESFYFKKPLLCSNTTSLPEIAGDAALYFNPESPENMAEVILQFFNNRKIEAELIEKSAERLKLFSWKKAASETLELYREILKNKNKN
jgi:glycosyltransferase involved in cell wall biosynthesis